MQRLNYHHLMYFWMVAREGGLAPASRLLRLSPPTLSGQIRTLEDTVGHELFRKSGRRLVLTDVGQTVYRYADQIFSLGRELSEVLSSEVLVPSSTLHVGVAMVLPKMVVHELLEPVLALDPAPKILCHEGTVDVLTRALAAHTLDVVLADIPLAAGSGVRAFNHELGSCGVTFFALARHARGYQRRFPASLHDAPMLLPLPGSALRRDLEVWFDAHGLVPRVVAEFEDSALLKAFGAAGRGVFCAPTPVAHEVKEMYGVVPIGATDEVTERFFAISLERRIRSPAVMAISSAARGVLFSRSRRDTPGT
ncbi:MAG: transcriptional activator NhaR [Myxococcales bacterium]|nr:transcriptional activator NhaR [Myxococcales bacterium]